MGVWLAATADAPAPAVVARLAEERGFESFWVGEHTHLPVQGTLEGQPTGPAYGSLLDPFVALTAAATVTHRLLLGTCACLVGQRDPIVTAKEVASLDVVSGGRVLLGVAAGWNEAELRNHRVDPRHRYRRQRECVQAMIAIWTQEVASFHGQLVSFDGVWARPRPVQRPHPPVLVANGGPGAVERVLAYGDGWMPTVDDADIVPRWQQLEDRAGHRVGLSVALVPPEPAAFEHWRGAGADRVIVAMNYSEENTAMSAGEAEAFLDRLAVLAASV